MYRSESAAVVASVPVLENVPLFGSISSCATDLIVPELVTEPWIRGRYWLGPASVSVPRLSTAPSIAEPLARVIVPRLSTPPSRPSSC